MSAVKVALMGRPALAGGGRSTPGRSMLYGAFMLSSTRIILQEIPPIMHACVYTLHTYLSTYAMCVCGYVLRQEKFIPRL